MAQSPGHAADGGTPLQPPPAVLPNGVAGGGRGTAGGAYDAAPAAAADGPDRPPMMPCLDASHPIGCTSCTPAPDEADVPFFELVGDQGRKNGEKRLKSLLSKTPQWRSKAERAAAAAACDAAGYENLARVLRNDVTSAALRKRDMIALARHWGYRSCIWRRRVVRGRAERRTRAAPAAAAEHEPPGAPWLLDDVSPTALGLALADIDALEFGPPGGWVPPWPGS